MITQESTEIVLHLILHLAKPGMWPESPEQTGSGDGQDGINPPEGLRSLFTLVGTLLHSFAWPKGTLGRHTQSGSMLHYLLLSKII